MKQGGVKRAQTPMNTGPSSISGPNMEVMISGNFTMSHADDDANDANDVSSELAGRFS